MNSVVVIVLLLATTAAAIVPLTDVVEPGAKLQTIVGGGQWLEGPVWLARFRTLLFSDTQGLAVHRHQQAEHVVDGVWADRTTLGLTTVKSMSGPNGLALDAAGRLFVCVQGDRRVLRFDVTDDGAAGRYVVVADRYGSGQFNSPDDVVVASNGDVIFTDPGYGGNAAQLAFAGVFVVHANATTGGYTAPTLIDRRLISPNGVALSHDERQLFVSDTNSATVYVYPRDPITGAVSDSARRQFFHCSTGYLDGIKLDRHGRLFAAGHDGVQVVDTDGSLIGVLAPRQVTTNVALDDTTTTLFITTPHSVLSLRLRSSLPTSSPSPSPSSSHSLSREDHPEKCHATSCLPQPARNWCEDLISRTRAFLAHRYATPAARQAAGYLRMSLIENGIEHWNHAGYINDDVVFDEQRIEALFVRGGKLLGGLYVLLPNQTMADAPTIGLPLAQFHVHENFCCNNLFTDCTTSARCPPRFLLWETPMIHVWLADTQRCGPFAGVEDMC